ncbi:DUF4192 domain-containing protein [Actinoplanes sp. GCM10030250]|uniref:DUF4192 domain-containing protein n=1 Tax=Actinoplanes sp. GCM10030250 TaxID=3273376 RepID=UPI0036132ACC
MTADCSVVIRTPSELIAAVPFIMGYHPADSLALVGLTRARVGFAACFDLPPPECDDEDLHEGAAEIAGLVARQGTAEMMVVGYGPPHRVTPAVLRLVQALRLAGVRVHDAVRVTGGRWWSYVCQDPLCCPPDGTPCLPGDSVIAAEATFRGQVALPSRSDLNAQVAPVGGETREAMVAATGRARKRFTELLADGLREQGRGAERYGRLIRRAGRTAVRDAERRYRAGRPLSHDDVAWLGAVLVHKAVQDYALDRTHLGPANVDRTNVDRTNDEEKWRIGLWTDVLRRVEPAYAAAPACLLSYAAWRAGMGALARIAVDRALREEPEHQLAGLLHEILGRGLGPHLFERGGARRRPK